MPTVHIDGVGPVEFPDDMSQGEIVQAIERDILPRYSQRPAQPPQGGSALGTALGSVVSGGGSLLSTVGSLGGMVLPGVGYDNALTRAGRGVQEYGESLMSEEMRAKRAALSAAVKEAEDQGLVAEASAALRMLAQNPSLIGSMLLEQIPMFIATGGAGRAAMGAVQLGTRGAVRAAAAGAERQAAAEAAAQLAGRVGTGTAIGTGAALQGGEVAGQAYQDIMSLPDATLANSPAYQALTQRMSGEEARKTLAEEAAQQAGLMGAGISGAAAAALPGAEKALFSKKLSERVVRRVLTGAAGEGAQEAIEEGGGKIAQNIAARRADTERDLTRGAAGAAAIGGTLGAIMGGGIAGVRGPTPPPAEARSPITQQVINDYLAGRDLPPEAVAVAENAIASGQPPAPPSEPTTQAAVPPLPEAAAQPPVTEAAAQPPVTETAGEPTTQAAVTPPVTPAAPTVAEPEVPSAAGAAPALEQPAETPSAEQPRNQKLASDQASGADLLRYLDLSARETPEATQPATEAAAPAGVDPKEDLRKARIAERRAERIIKQTADPNKKAFAQVQLAQAQETRAKAEEAIKAQEAAAAKEEQGRLRTAFNRASETINKRLGELENMGTQGKEVADGVRRALDNRALDSQQLLGAFIGADVLVKQLPGKANHRIEFVEKLLPTEEEIKAVEASGGKLGAEVQGRRDAAKALIELSLSKRFLDPGYVLMRETAAHEAFHVLQDYYKKFDKGFAQALDNAFAKGSDLKDGKAMFADIIKDKSLKNKLQRLRSAAGNMSYFDLLVRDLKAPITPREAQAYVYGALVDSLRRGNQITGIKPGFSRFINFLRDFFSRMGNALSGLGYGTTSELLTREAGRGGARFTEELARPAQAQAEMSARGAEPTLLRDINQLIEDAKSQTNWRDWYARHEQKLNELFGEDASLFKKLLSATSQQASVGSNVGLAIKAYKQLLNGEPFTGYLPAVIKNLERIRSDEGLRGRKISQYGQAVTADEAAAAQAVAVDMHIASLLFGVKTPTKRQVEVATQVITDIANRLGWEPRQVQAALWAFNQVRAGKEPKSYDFYLNKRAEEIRAFRSAFSGREGGGVQAGAGTAERTGEVKGVDIASATTEDIANELASAAPDIEFSAREGVSLKPGNPDVVEAGNNVQMFWDIEGGGIIFMNAYKRGDVLDVDAIAPEDIKKNPKLKTISTGSYGPFGLRVPLGVTGTRKLINDITSYLKSRAPEINYIEGQRITGARQNLPEEQQMIRRAVYRDNPAVEFAARSVGMTTPDFVDWFGESKVSDRNGNPIPAYTGSVNQFNAFDLNAASPDSLYGRGFWFSTNPEMAGGVPRNVSSLEEAYTQGEKAQAGYAFQGRKLTINPPSEDKMDAVKELLTDRYVLGKPELQKLKAAASLGANEFAKEFNKVASAAPRYSRQRDQLINFVGDLDLNSDMAGAATVYPAYLSIQNPFDMSETFTHPNFDGKILRYSFMDENGKMLNQSVVDNIWKHWISMFSTKPDFDVKKYSEIFWQDMKREFQSPSVAYRSKETISNEDLYNFMVSSADYENQRNGTNIPPKDMVNEALRYRGYDGIKSTSTDIPSERSLPTEERTKTPSDVWVAFDPTQIKSIFNKFEQGVATQPEFAARQSPLLTDPNYSFYMDALTAQPIARSGLFGGVFRRFVGAMDNTALYGTPNTPERLRDALVRTSVNRNHPIWMLQQLAERMGVLNGRDIGIAAESALMNTGRMQLLTQVAGLKFDPTTGDIDIRNDVKSLMEIFEGKVDTKNQDILQRYLIALREKDLRGVGRTGMKSIKGQPFTDQMINDIIQQTEQAHPEFVDVAKDLKKFSDSLLDFAVDTGIMTRAKAQELALIFYTPFYREMEADSQSDPNQILGPNVNNVLRNTTSALDKKLGGGDGNVGDLLENILRNADSILRAGLKNHAIKMTAEVARDVGLGQVVQSAAGNNIVTYRVNGNEVHFRVDDPILFTAMATAPAKTRGALHQAMAKMASFFREMITLAPSFMWANLYRGKFQAYAQEGASFSPFTTMKGMKDFLKANPSYLAFTAQTGFGGYTLGMGERNIAAKMKKQLDDRGIFGELMRGNLFAPFSKAIDGLSKISEATELAERLALYERLKRQGMTDKQAAFQAYMLAPFSRQGSGQGVFGNVVQSLIPLVPFLNAKIQGLYRLVENEKGNKTILKIPQQIFLRSMIITAFSTALYGLALSGGNEDELDKLTVDDIIRYDWAFLPGGGKIALPRNFEIGSFFGAVPILAMEAYRKGHTDDLTKAAVSIGTSTLFFNPIPQAVLPLVSSVTNYDFFRQKEIENYAMRNLPAEDRVDRSTTTIARLASAATGYALAPIKKEAVSPIKMQALLDGYLGSIGSGIMAGFDTILSKLDVIPNKPAGPFGDPTDIPAILGNASGLGRFYRTDETKVSRFVGDFYTLKEQATQVSNAINEANLRGDYNRAIELQTEKGQLAMMNRTIARTSTRLSELNRQIRSIEAGPFDSETKLALIAPLRQQRDMMAKQTVQQARAVGAI